MSAGTVVRAVIMAPVLQLCWLSALSLLVGRAFLKPGASPTASGAIVMAIGIFVLDALQQMPLRGLAMVSQLVTLELLVIWACLAASYLASWRQGALYRHTTDPVNRFAVGTWVAGTSVLGLSILLALPSWRPLAGVLGIITALLWMWFLTLAVPGFRAIAADPGREHARGRILLSTVSTQSLVILAVALFRGQVPLWLAATGIALGCLFYAAGTALIAVRYLGQRGWRLAEDWDNTNCILHGAVSITGLAAITSGALAGGWLITLWLWTAGMFVLVEGVELLRARSRVRDYGWEQGLLTYHVSQWARNFTFGMFYAFTLHLHLTMPAAGGISPLGAAWSLVAGYGQYAVLALLLIEVGLFFKQNTQLPKPMPATQAADLTPAQVPSAHGRKEVQSLEHDLSVLTEPLCDDQSAPRVGVWR